MKVSTRFYQTLTKILEKKHNVKIDLTVTEKGEQNGVEKNQRVSNL